MNCAFAVHKALGPGLLESVYERALAIELKESGLFFERQREIPVRYKGRVIEKAFYADIIVENKVILELKSVQRLESVHAKQLLTYLKLSGVKLGFLINFNEELLKNGIKRIINGRLE